MKGRLLVVFHSNHGYVKRYVDILGNALGCDAVPDDRLRGDMLAAYDKVLFISSLKNEEIVGIKKFSEYFEAVYKKLIVCGVGLTPFRHYMPARIKDTSISVAYEKFIPVFYVQGGFDADELSRLEKFAVAMRIRQIKMSSIINDDDKFFMDAMSVPVDEVKQENIQVLIDYLEGKEVDEKLYSPPEITDPEEEKRFFAELEEASKTPENKKRAIKKKLKGGRVKHTAPDESVVETADEKTDEKPESTAADDGGKDSVESEQNADAKTSDDTSDAPKGKKEMDEDKVSGEEEPDIDEKAEWLL